MVNETIAAIAAITQLAEQSLAVLQRVRMAIDRMKNSASYLTMVSADLTNVIVLVDAIKQEPELQQNSLTGGISSLLYRATLLEAFVNELERKSSRGNLLRKFASQLDKGPTEQQRLDDLMGHLSQAKETLFGLVQVMHVGISSRGSNVVVNLKIVNQVNSKLQNVPGLENGLQMVELLKEHYISNNGEPEVVLNKDILDKLTKLGQDNVVALGVPGRTNQVVGNKSKPFAAMVNAPIGDGTSNPYAFHMVDHNIVLGNTAERGSFMMNAPNSRDIYDKTSEHSLAMAHILASNAELWKSHTSGKMEE
ncbi:hypothetical protein CC80DRAFT_496335 [Byssothecium circinans]|uniref:Uncharacterized protein n=1 Tax=Byssothecium circinans TaxID=147558 RepID=A0A6A5TFC8_9PLEO|nr:hypothetical protein CC80DRAFT_496335 [Byssothecium circinans]